MTVKKDKVTLEAKVDLEDVTGLNCSWSVEEASDSSADINAVHLHVEGENNNKVEISPVTGKKGGKLNLVLKVKAGTEEASKKIKLSVYTEYAVKDIELSKSEKGSDSEKKLEGDDKKAAVTDTLHASLNIPDDASEEDKNKSDYTFRWEKLDDGEYKSAPGANDSSSYKLEKEGTYRVTVSREGDYRQDFEKNSDYITVSKIPVEVVWTDAERVYDASSNSIEYTGTGSVKRTDTGSSIDPETINLSDPIDLKLTDESAADAKTYENVEIPIDEFEELNKYDVQSSKVGKIEVTPRKIKASVSVWGKNFDNTTDVEDANDGDELKVTWEDLDSALTNIGESLELLVNGTKLEASDLQYQYESDDARKNNVSEDTEVNVILKASGSEKDQYAVSGEGIKSGNYSVAVTYNKATIKKVDIKEAAEVENSATNNEKIYVKESPASLKAEEGYTIATELGEPGVEYSQAADVEVGENGGLVYYAKNSDGDIAKIAVNNVFIDNAAPTVALENIKKASNDIYVNKYKVTDTGSGIKEVWVLAADNIVNYSEGGEWEKITLPETTDGEGARDFEFTVKVPAYGYVNIYAVDNLGWASDSSTNNHMVIYENTAPAVDVSCAGMSDPTKNKAVTVSVDDGERSIGAKSVSIKLLDSEGKAADDALSIDGDLPEGFKFENGTYSRTQEDIPDSIESAGKFRSFTAKFLINGENLELTGDCKLIATATDYLGNTSEEKEWTLVFDNKSPEVSITLEDDNKEKHTVDGIQYSNASDEDELKITITDQYLGHKDSEGKSGEYSAVLYDAENTEIDRKDLDLENITGGTADIVFTHDELKKNEDGKITVKVTAKDYAGSVNGNTEQNQFSFVLDTTAPVMTESETDPEHDREDNTTNSLYYKDNFTTKITIVETNMSENSLNGGYNGEAKGKFEVKKTSVSDEYCVTYSASDNGKYGNLTISGEDYAGNLLRKDDSFSSKVVEDDAWDENTTGSFATTYSREIAKRIPIVTVNYTKLDDSHILANKAYYNNENDVIIDPTLTVAYEKTEGDTEGSNDTGESGDVVDSDDLALIEYAVGIDGAEITDSDWKPFDTDKVTISDCTSDGEYQIFVKGTNKALIPVKVQETSPQKDEELEIVDTQEGEYKPRYTLVLDKTSPVAEFDISTEASNQKLNKEVGNRFYFNKEHTLTVTINENNFALDGDKGLKDSTRKLCVDYRWKPDSDYEDGSSVKLDDKDFVSVKGSRFNNGEDEGSGVVFTYTVKENGIIDYSVKGEDLAGNKLIFPDQDNSKDFSTYFSLLDETAISYPIVTGIKGFDLFKLTVDAVYDPGNDKEKTTTNAYTMESKSAGDVGVSEYAPYQKANSAIINAEVYSKQEDSAESKIPFIISYDVHVLEENDQGEAADSKTTKSTNLDVNKTDVKNNCESIIDLSEKSRIIWVENFTATDLAGNVLGYSKNPVTTEKIYLDPNLPEFVDTDDQMPVVIVNPVNGPSGYVPAGADYGLPDAELPIYNTDVQFRIQVKDPYGPNEQNAQSHGSTGLKEVKYTLRNLHTKKDKTESLYTFDESKTKDVNGKTVLNDEDFVYEFNNDDLTIKDNYNPLELIVTASDNAGNVTTHSYLFGIDKTKPKFTLSYDNNKHKNGFYFDNGRTATIQITERNIDPGKFKINIYGKAHGSQIKNTGKFIEEKGSEGDSWIKGENNGNGNGDNDTYTKIIRFPNDGDYRITITPIDQDSEIPIYDYANNSSKLKYNKDAAPFEFVIDQTAPKALIEMGPETSPIKADEDGMFYYRANNCGLTVKFHDSGHEFGMKGSGVSYSVRIKGEKDEVRRALDLENFSFDDIRANKKKYRTQQKIRFTSEELAQGENRLLRDGPYTITVTAVDAAGNVADTTYFANKSRGCVLDSEKYTGKFILDTVRPIVTSISTSSAVSEADRKYPQITDNKIYKDTNSVYYNTNVKIRIVVKDEYTRDGLFKGTMSKEGDGKNPSVNAVISSKGNNTYAVYTLTGDHQYKDLILKGFDKAGNQLQLISSDYSHSDVDILQQDGENSKAGQVHLKYGKVVDLTAPEAWIKYESTDNANMYKEGEDKEKVRAYYNEPVDVKISFSDNYQLDGKKLFAGEKGVDKALNFKSTSSKYTVPTIRISEDCRKRFTAYGTDRALNQTKVHEMNPKTDTRTEVTYVGGNHGISAGAFNKDMTSQKPYLPKYQIIVDRTAPTFTMGVKSEKSTKQELQGGRYFFNKGYTATFTIDETNFDASKIELRRGSVTDNSSHYDSQSMKITMKNSDSALRFKEKVRSDTIDHDGVYRYAIFGSDKAGNALVPSSSANLDGTSTNVVVIKDELDRGSEETVADTSVHIVVDKVAPQGSMDITIGNNAIYKMDVNGNVTYAEPYRKETSATVKIKVFENVERTPVNIAYKIESTSSSNSKTVSNTQYKYNNNVSTTQNGQQIFRVAEYTFTDLAGNVRTYKSENQIYLDRAEPNIDKIAPTISIVAHVKSGANGYVDGQPLFKSDVPLSIHVSDPNSNKSSSGLAEITYTLTDAGSSSGSGKLHDKNNQKFTKNYKDQKLDFNKSYTVNVDGQRHNNNNIEIVVTAFDNAGNKREAKYHFGIDTTKPTVRVTYDNNSALNGEFFKADRTATVAVTERNFEPSKFHITTESGASVGGWSHSRNGGNGDRDVWTARVTYARDGNYTLKVSGEDLLGNPATDIKYEGTAPQKFTIDKTAPAVTVTYDNNDVANEKYYKASRTATIDINDVNFAGQNDIAVEATGGGVAPTVSFAGNTATLHFAEDGVYVFNGTVTDKAGNITTIPVQTEFVVDTKAPVLRFDNNRPFKVVSAADETKSDHPVTNQFFTDEVFAPGMTVLDTNCSTAPADAVLQIDGTKEAHHFLGTVGALENDGKQFRVSLSSTDFKVEKSSDDVYHVTAYAVDLAGNKSEVVEFDFSMNRFGSNFVTADDHTKNYIREQYYHNTTDKDLLIHEYNTNKLKKDSEKVELIMNGNTASRRELVRGKDYELKEDTAAGSTKGGRIYLYTIKNSVFEEEGDYSFSITSVDEANHTNSTSEIHTGQMGKDGKLKVSTFPIDFVVDKTPPVNELAGVSSQAKQSFNKNTLEVEIHPEDAQTEVEQVEIRRWVSKTDLFGNPVTPQIDEQPVEVRTYAYYAEGEKPADTETEYYNDLSEYMDTNDKIVINYDIQEKKDWQVVEVITTDSAGNKSVDIRAGGQDGLTESRREFLVTTDLFTRLVNSMAVRVGTVSAAALLLLLIVFLKRRKQKAGQ